MRRSTTAKAEQNDIETYTITLNGPYMGFAFGEDDKPEWHDRGLRGGVTGRIELTLTPQEVEDLFNALAVLARFEDEDEEED